MSQNIHRKYSKQIFILNILCPAFMESLQYGQEDFRIFILNIPCPAFMESLKYGQEDFCRIFVLALLFFDIHM